MKKIKLFLAIMVFSYISAFGQQQLNLADTFKNGKIEAINRTVSLYADDQNALEMDAKQSDGLAIFEDTEFSTGTLEIELLGENNPGKSFIGIAFNIQNDSTYEAIYFRPFNFVAEEQIRKDHMTQYIFHPEFTWRKLRAERTGEFENEITPAPNPDDWFKVKINIGEEKVMVYVNGSTEPVMTADRLTATTSNTIGLWTGFGSSGRFRNMIMQ